MSADIEIALTFVKVTICIGLCIAVPVLFMHIASYLRYGRGKDRFHIRKSLFACAALLCIELCITSAMMFMDWRGNDYGCHIIPSFAAFAFVLVKQAQFLFLYYRAKIVHAAMHLHSTRMIVIRWIVFASATGGVLVCFAWAQFVFIHGMVNEATGVCYMYTESPAEIIVFACCDFGLSMLMVALFVIPLTHHASLMREDSKRQLSPRGEHDEGSRQNDIRTTAVRNLCMSSISVSLALIALVSYAGVLASTKEGVPETEYRFLWAFAAPVTESYISFVILHNITRVWMPCKRHTWFRQTSSKEDSKLPNATAPTVAPRVGSTRTSPIVVAHVTVAENAEL